MHLSVGDSLDRYEIEGRLGSSRLAVVYAARHRSLHSLHAIKVLSVSTAEARAWIVQQGRAQAQVQHPNVVAVSDVLLCGEDPALVMERCVHGTLVSALATAPPDRKRALLLFRGVLSGLRAAHQRGLVHGNLSAENVLLADVDGSRIPKIADFGIAGSEGENVAPELRAGSRPTIRSDLYALGGVLRLLVGEVSGGALGRLLEDLQAPDPRDRPRDTLRVRDRLAAIHA